jgi:hypothetical protein
MIKIKKTKKSQAAFEFLVTYGWAIFGVLIVLAGLTYFGFFSTERFVNDACNFGDQIRCEDYILNGGNARLNMTLRNNFGVDIDIVGITINSDYGNNIACAANPNNNIRPGGLFNSTCTLYASSIPATEKVRAKAVIIFRRAGASTSHNQTGTIVITSQ